MDADRHVGFRGTIHPSHNYLPFLTDDMQRSIRVARIVYRNVGQGGSHALLQKMPGEAVRVTLDLARPWTFKPGQHVYLYIPSIGGWTSHPFTVAWSEDKEDKKKMHGEKGALAHTRQDIAELQKTNLSLIVRRRTGFTDKLYQKVDEAPNGNVAVRAFVEGPYGAFIILFTCLCLTHPWLLMTTANDDDDNRWRRSPPLLRHSHALRRRHRDHTSSSTRP